jgi:predicted nucleotidyltransferase
MEAKLTEFVNRLKSAAADNLKAAILYGSAVAGEFLEKQSDLNILCVVESAGSADLEHLHSVAEWWLRQGNPAPLVFTLEELKRSADIFAIELLDIKHQHRLLYGLDVLEGFEVPLQLHHLQVERELRIGWLRLRQAILIAPQKRGLHLEIMLASVSTFCVLFRHALIALSAPPAHSKREALDRIATLAGADPSAFHAILDFREGKRKRRGLDIEALLHTYHEFVEVVTNEVDRRLEAK